MPTACTACPAILPIPDPSCIFPCAGLVVTPFLPGDSLLFATGALAALGKLNLPLLMGCYIVAATLGDAVNYAGEEQLFSCCLPDRVSCRFRLQASLRLPLAASCPQPTPHPPQSQPPPAVGNKLGSAALNSKLLKREHIAKTEEFYAKYGGKTGARWCVLAQGCMLVSLGEQSTCPKDS